MPPCSASSRRTVLSSCAAHRSWEGTVSWWTDTVATDTSTLTGAGGSQDGYFLLYCLDPAAGGIGSYEGGYNSLQTIITDLKKAGEDDTPQQSLIVASGPFVHEKNETYGDEELRVDGMVDQPMFYNPLGFIQNVNVAVAFEPVAGGERVLTSPQPLTFQVNGGFRAIYYNNPTLPDGDYKVYAVYTPTTENDYRPIGVPYEYADYITATVANGEITYNNDGYKPGEKHLIITRVEGLDHTPYGAIPSANLSIANVGDIDFYGPIKLTITLDDDPQYTFEITGTASVPAGGFQNVEFDGDVQPIDGNYTMTISSDDESVHIVCDDAYHFQMDAKGNRAIETNYACLAVTPEYYDLSKTVSPTFVLDNASDKDVNVTMTINLVRINGNETETVITAKSPQISIPANRGTEGAITMGNIAQYVEPGDYYWQIQNSEGKAMSFNIPVHFLRTAEDREKQIAYQELSAREKIARVASPLDGTYAGTVTIPETVGDGYKMSTTLDGTIFTFSQNVKEIVLPQNLKAVGNGAFYQAGSLEKVTFTGAEAPKLGHLVFPEGMTAEGISVPDANIYARAAGWEDIDFPFVVISTKDGLKVKVNDREEYPAQYYLNADETLTLTIEGGKCQVGVYLSDGTFTVTDVTDGTFTLPALGTKYGTVTIGKDLSRITETADTPASADVYTVDGLKVLDNADAAALRNLPAGIYIWGNVKYIKK